MRWGPSPVVCPCRIGAAGLPEHHQAAVARGFTSEQIPDNCRDLRKPIQSESRRLPSCKAYPSAQEILRFLATQMHHRPVIDMLEAFEVILRVTKESCRSISGRYGYQPCACYP